MTYRIRFLSSKCPLSIYLEDYGEIDKLKTNYKDINVKIYKDDDVKRKEYGCNQTPCVVLLKDGKHGAFINKNWNAKAFSEFYYKMN